KSEIDEHKIELGKRKAHDEVVLLSAAVAYWMPASKTTLLCTDWIEVYFSIELNENCF
ncbi:hypothetical protein A2U01_0030136, partial [Trifolium medium]|nr:hypothetical protein [Trifolium medium]